MFPYLGLGLNRYRGSISDGVFNNHSLLLDGSAEFIDADNVLTPLSSTTQGTIIVRINVLALSGNHSIVTFGDTNASEDIFFFINSSGQLNALARTGGFADWQLRTDEAVIITDTWITVGLTQDGTSPKLWIDGAEAASTFVVQSDKTTWFNDLSGLDNGRIGAHNKNSAGNIFLLNAYIGDTIFTSDAKNAATMLDIHNGGVAKDESGLSNLVGYYRMGDAAGDNWNSDAANEWTFKNSGSSLDITTSGCEEADVVENVPFNQISASSVFENSITYTPGTYYNIKSTTSQFSFTTTATTFSIKGEPVGTRDDIAILINGVYSQTVAITEGVWSKVTVAGGSKVVTLVEPRVSGTAFSTCTLSGLQVDPSLYTRTNPSNVAERFVFLGDSIAQGALGTNEFTDGYAQLFKYTDSKNVSIIGYAGAALKQLAEASLDRAETVSWVTDAFSDTTTTKKLVIGLSTNDHDLGRTAANITTWGGDLLDDINTADSSIQIFVLGPTTKSTEDSLLDDYRTALSDLCTTRAYCTYIELKTVLTYPGADFGDTIHPSTAGHVKIHDFIDGTIL